MKTKRHEILEGRKWPLSDILLYHSFIRQTWHSRTTHFEGMPHVTNMTHGFYISDIVIFNLFLVWSTYRWVAAPMWGKTTTRRGFWTSSAWTKISPTWYKRLPMRPATNYNNSIIVNTTKHTINTLFKFQCEYCRSFIVKTDKSESLQFGHCIEHKTVLCKLMNICENIHSLALQKQQCEHWKVH